MASAATAPRNRGARTARSVFDAAGLGLGLGVSTYLSLLVASPIAALAWKAADAGGSAFWADVTDAQTVAAIELTALLSAAVVAINILTGTVMAWVLVRDTFPGKRIVDALLDLPFALPTIVSGLVLLSLYGPSSPVGVDVAYSRIAISLALLFITLPFVARAVQPVIEQLDREAEEASRTLGASGLTTFRRVIIPTLVPAMIAGGGLAFARALGEFGSIVLLAGNLPYETEVASVRIFGLIESDDPSGAAAVSIVLLLLALLVQVGSNALHKRVSHDGG